MIKDYSTMESPGNPRPVGYSGFDLLHFACLAIANDFVGCFRTGLPA